MNKHNIAIGLIIAAGALTIVDVMAGLQSKNGTMPAWYPAPLASLENALPFSLELILAGTGVVLLYV